MDVTLLITDVTRMSGDRVCVAGVTEKGISVRPIFQYRHIAEGWLYDKGQVVIHPFSLVKFKLKKNRPDPPRTEDWLLDSDHKQKVNTLRSEERIMMLKGISYPDIAEIFGAEIKHAPGSFIREGEGYRSLGTVEVIVTDFFYGYKYGKWDYRITFKDQSGTEYSLGVTDLSFRYYCDHLRETEGFSPDRIAENLKKRLMSDATFLRIGLARPTWDKHPHCCFLQITGVYTFPDYLNGRCFADFKRP